jgi:hypothetical protein
MSELNNTTGKLMELLVSSVLKKHGVNKPLKTMSESDRTVIKETVEALKQQVNELLEKSASVTTTNKKEE